MVFAARANQQLPELNLEQFEWAQKWPQAIFGIWSRKGRLLSFIVEGALARPAVPSPFTIGQIIQSQSQQGGGSLMPRLIQEHSRTFHYWRQPCWLHGSGFSCKSHSLHTVFGFRFSFLISPVVTQLVLHVSVLWLVEHESSGFHCQVLVVEGFSAGEKKVEDSNKSIYWQRDNPKKQENRLDNKLKDQVETGLTTGGDNKIGPARRKRKTWWYIEVWADETQVKTIRTDGIREIN